MVIWIQKADGSREPFRVNKIKRTARRAGASPRLASQIAGEVARTVHDGMTSQEILRMILRRLRQEEPAVACRYDLKAAIMRLGIAGFNFEQLMAEILKEYGYEVMTNQILKGKCVQHEIDILGKQEGKMFLIECKYHHQPGSYTGLKESLYTWARLMDLQQGGHKLDQAWLVTNTKFSADALQYGGCQGLRLLGWRTPHDQGLQAMIEQKSLYPITVLNVDEAVLARLSKNKLFLLKDLEGMDPARLAVIAGISEQKSSKVLELAKTVCEIRNI